MRFSINMETVFRDIPMEKAFETLHLLGYDTFERWRVPPEDIACVQALMQTYGMHMSLCCPDFFTMNDPAVHDEYEASLHRVFDTLRQLNCRHLVTQVGQDRGVSRQGQHDAIVRCLRRVAPLLEARGYVLLVEPLNDVRDHKGYYLTSSHEGFDIIREVNSPSVRLLYDIYHQLHMGEDVQAQIASNLDLIGHFHMAGFPERDDRIYEGYDYRPLFAYMNRENVQACMGVELFTGTLKNAEALLESLQTYATAL